MATAQYSFSITVGGYSSSKSYVVSGDHPNAYEITLPVAHAVSSWVKTDADTAAGNLTSGHGQTSGTYDVYWTGGARYGVDVTVSTNALALDGGTGTDFPASATSTVVICKQVAINTAIDGDAVQLGYIKLGYLDEATVARGRLLFEDASGDDIADLDTSDGINANVTNVYNIANGDTNPFTGDPITVCHASHSNTAAAATLVISMLEDSTP